MLDDDVVPPTDVFQKLAHELDMQPEFDYIAAVVPSRSTNVEPMIFMNPEMGAHWHWKVGDVFEVSEAATACMMFRTSIFDSVPKPWFRDLNTIEERIDAGDKSIDAGIQRGAMTDDIFFCRKAKEHGHRLLAHGGVICQHYDRKGNAFELPQDSYPFKGGEADISDALKIDGWMQPSELKWLAEKAKDKKNILEVGSFLGRSTRAMAQNTSGRITCVDTWNISDVPRGGVDDKPIEDLSGESPDVMFERFKVNMLGLNNIHVVRADSVTASRQIPEEIKFDMIFIDAAHDYDNVKADIEAWRPKLAEGGLLCGHDYNYGSGPKWEGVIKAVNELAPNALPGVGSIWYVPTA
jgi:SAM-dependent methyltransferase